MVPHGLPPTTRVGALEFKIVPMNAALAVTQFGMCDFAKQEIQLDPNMDPAQAAAITIHEHLHAIWEQASLGYSDRQQEKVVTGLAYGLALLMRDNPQLVARLLELLNPASK